MHLAALTTHLERCSNHGCRRLVLNTDVKCPHCGVERTSYKVARSFWAVFKFALLPLIVGFLAVTFFYLSAVVKERQEESRIQHGLNP